MNTQNWKRNSIRFLTAQTISLFGSSLVQYAIIWHITLTTQSGLMLTISTVCGFLPQILIALVAGVWIDRFDRKRIIMISDGMIALATLLLALNLLLGSKSTWPLYVVLMIRSAGTGIQIPAVNAIIPQLVPKEKLLKINGINSTLSSMMMLLSPALSGAILTFAAFQTTLFIDVVTAVIGIGIMATIKVPVSNHEVLTSKSTFEGVKEGFAYLKDHRFMKYLLFYQISILFLISPSAFLTPLMVSRTFGAEVWRLTASEMTYSLGMILGGFLITAWGGFNKRMHTTLLAGLLYGSIMLGLGLSQTFLVYLLLNTMIGIASPCYNTPMTVYVQESVAPAMHGRVFSMMQIASACALPFGMLFFGPIADFIPIQLLLIGSGSLVVLLSVLLLKKQPFN